VAAAREREYVIRWLTRAGVDPLRATSPPPDWSAVLGFALRSGVISPLLDALRTHGELEHVPAFFQEELLNLRRRIGLRNAQLLGELETLSRAFAGAGIPLIFMKGAAFLSEGESDLSLRPMEDIDLLVKEQDLKAADGILAAEGYVPDESWHSQEWYFRNHHHLAPRCHPGKGVTVEVHRNLLYPGSPFRIDPEGLWERSRPSRRACNGVRVLSAEDTVLYLCLHLSYTHCFRGTLKTLLDIRRVVDLSGNGIHWDKVVQQAESWSCADGVLTVLLLARETLGVEIPAATLEDIRRGSSFGIFRRMAYEGLARRYAFQGAESNPLLPGWVLEILFREIPRPEPFRKVASAVLTKVADRSVPSGDGPEGGPTCPVPRRRSSSVLRLIGKAATRIAARRSRPVLTLR
jgi:hypothetical protein